MLSAQSEIAPCTDSECDDDVFELLSNGDIRGVTVAKLHGFQHYSQVIKQAQVGDLIEIQRDFYSHYVLYLGDSKVMNVDAEDNPITEARVRVRTLDSVCGGSQARVQNLDGVASTEFQVAPKPISDIINAAKGYENKLVPYQFGFRNCEYYCTLWRYGVGFSTQAARENSTPVAWFVGEVANTLLYTGGYENTQSFSEADGYDKYRQLAACSTTTKIVNSADAASQS